MFENSSLSVQLATSQEALISLELVTLNISISNFCVVLLLPDNFLYLTHTLTQQPEGIKISSSERLAVKYNSVLSPVC
jgi:hypothetical protein